MNKKFLVFATVSVSVFAFVVLSFSSTSVVYASTNKPSNAIIQVLSDQSCSLISEFIDYGIKSYTEDNLRHVENHKIIINKLLNFADKLTQDGVNTGQLKSDISNLEQMMNDYNSKYNQFINTMEEAKVLGCNGNPVLYQEKLVVARKEQSELKGIAQNILDFINNTIRQDINDLHSKGN